MSDFSIVINRTRGDVLQLRQVDTYLNFFLVDNQDSVLAGIMGYGQPMRIQRTPNSPVAGWFHIGTNMVAITDLDALLAIAENLGITIT